jgi:hypothetical protein
MDPDETGIERNQDKASAGTRTPIRRALDVIG